MELTCVIESVHFRACGFLSQAIHDLAHSAPSRRILTLSDSLAFELKAFFATAVYVGCNGKRGAEA
jgi:hypothetical protein